MNFWVPMKTQLDDVARGASSAFELNPGAVEQVASRTEALAADLVDNPRFQQVPGQVDSVRLGGYGHAGEVAELHTIAHTIVTDVLNGVHDDLTYFAKELKRCVSDAADQDDLNATVLNAIAGVETSNNAEQAEQRSRDENAPLAGEGDL